MNSVQHLILYVIVFIGFSCTEDYPEVGSEFFDEVSFEVVTWDTLTMKMSTVFFDSTVTNSPARLLIGEVSDESFGNTEAQTYLNLSRASTSGLDDFDDLEYLYTTLTLYYDGYSIGDTTESMTLEVYALQDEMETDDDGYFYNFSSLELTTDDLEIVSPIGTIEFDPEPLKEDSIEIILDSDLGAEIFELFERDFEEDEFLDILQGITIKSVGSKSVIGFTVSPVLNIYYDESSELDVEDKVITFTTVDQTLVFNQISSDRSGTSIENIEESLELGPDADEQLYIQGGLGLALKIELPHIEQIIQPDEELLLDQVTISLALGNEMPDDFGSLENGVEIFRVDENNDILYQYDVSLVWNLETEFDAYNEFEIDITAFINEQLAITTADNEDALLVRIPTERYSSVLDQVIVYNQGADNENSKIKLNVIKIK